MAPRRPIDAGWRDTVVRSWWQPRPDLLSRALTPLAWLAGVIVRRRAAQARTAWRAPCPVIVVGNLVVGGAGKTPTVIALVQAMQAAGYRPGIVSRGHGRAQEDQVQAVEPASPAAEVGDEPLLLRRRTGVPVVVGADRVAAVQALLSAHPDVDLVIADDGLQHHALARDAEVWLFDERGVGNGRLLPAGPLRQPLPARLPPRVAVLYNAPRATTPLPGAVLQRRLSGAVALSGWHQGAPMDWPTLDALRGRHLCAIAGIASPARFFSMLQALGLSIDAQPLPDHAPLHTLPWPDGTPDVVCTEKDAVKLDPARCGATRVWVVGLDLTLPEDLPATLQGWIAPPRPTP